MRSPVKLEFDLPIRINMYKLKQDKLDIFNNGDFVRTNYRFLYRLAIDKGPGKTYIELATPSFMQVLYSIKVLWNAYQNKPYDRHDHPVVMTAWDVAELGIKDASQKVANKFQKTYSKHKK